MRGRKPESPKVKDLAAGRFKVVEGGAGSGDGGEPPSGSANDPPAWVKAPAAREMWAKLLPQLLLRKQYLSIFEAELGRYCVAFGQYVEAVARLDDDGGPVVKSSKNVNMLSQWWVVANRAHETMLRLAADLGLNPVAQMRLEGLQLDLFNQPPRRTGTDGAPATGFSQFRRDTD